MGTCKECGKTLKPLKFTLGGGAQTFMPSYCFDCSDEAYEKHLESDRRLRISGAIERAGIPKCCSDVLGKEFRFTIGQRRAVKLLRKIDLWKLPSPYIWGSVGCGKSFLASALISRYMRKNGRSAYFIPVGNLISGRYLVFDEERCKVQAPIVLDDIGNHIINQKIIGSLFNVINFRLNENLPTVITCNIDPIALGDRIIGAVGDSETFLAESLCDRLLELCKPIRIEGKSIRTAKFIAENS